MSNAVYPLFKQALLGASASVSLNVNDTTDGPYISLIDTGTYTYSAAHDMYDDVSGEVGTAQRIATPTIVTGLFDGDNVTYTAVTGASVEALIIRRKNSGASSTQRLVCFIDTSVTGLPVSPNGGDISITFNASGIVQF